MSIRKHLESFAGRQLAWYDPKRGPLIGPPGRTKRYAYGVVRGAARKGRPPASTDIGYRIDAYYDSRDKDGPDFTDIFTAFLADERVGLVEALVIGPWEYLQMIGSPEIARPFGTGVIVEELVAARERLAGLKALFLGDVICDECELDWLYQADVSPIFDAYPNLERIVIRGCRELSLPELRHRELRELTIESVGIPPQILDQIWAADLPELEGLELWFGSWFAKIDSAEALEPLLSGKLFPRLKRLGLRNSEIADELAVAVAKAPLSERLEELDLSLGSLGDEGARALIASPATRKLSRLDVHHHFISAEVLGELQALGMDVRADHLQEPVEYRGELNRYIHTPE